MTKPTKEEIIRVWQEAKSIKDDTVVLLKHIKENPTILFLWVLPGESIDEFSVAVKLEWDADDPFRASEDEALIEGYEEFYIDIDVNMMAFLLAESRIPHELG